MRLDTSEAAYQASICEYAELHGWEVYHTHDSRRSGWGFPDLVMVRPPRIVFAEVKAEKGQPTGEQCYWAELLTACGWRNLNDVRFGAEYYMWWPEHQDEMERVLR